MRQPSNYPPGVTGHEPEITGDDDDTPWEVVYVPPTFDAMMPSDPHGRTVIPNLDAPHTWVDIPADLRRWFIREDEDANESYTTIMRLVGSLGEVNRTMIDAQFDSKFETAAGLAQTLHDTYVDLARITAAYERHLRFQTSLMIQQHYRIDIDTAWAANLPPSFVLDPTWLIPYGQNLRAEAAENARKDADVIALRPEYDGPF